MIKKALYFGLGVLSVTRERAEKIMEDLVEKGEMTSEEAKQAVEDLIDKGEEEKQSLRNMMKEEIEAIKGKWSLVNRAEVDELKARIEELEKRLAQD